MRATPLRILCTCSLFVFVACRSSSSDRPADSPCSKAEDDVDTAGRTGLAGAKTGVTTAGEGIKTFGNSAAGLVEGGSGEAKKRWNEGKKETRETARAGKADTKREAHAHECR